MPDDLTPIEHQLASRGMTTYRQRPDQVVVSPSEAAHGPTPATASWITRLAGHWYLCTRGPRYYRVSRDHPIADVCEAFVDVGTSAQPSVPADLVARFGLIETDYDEFDGIWNAARPTA
jgi:hypothetical protein